MAFPKRYQPEIHPDLIKALFFTSKLQGRPMTKLLNEIVTAALADTEGMRLAREELRRAADRCVAA